MYKKKVTLVFILLTIINIVIFIFRDHFFYQPFASYKNLYDCIDNDCLKKWELYKDDYPAAELSEAKKITDSIIGNTQISTQEKVLKLGSFVHTRFKSQMGRPGTDLLKASPLKQYAMLCSSDSVKLWCGNFAGIFSYFCWSQGIVTRTIEIKNPSDHHVLNECYIPEQQLWQMVDPTNNLLMVRASDTVLNLQTFRQSLAKNIPISALQGSDTLTQHKIDPLASHILNYYKPDHPQYYYHRVDNEKAYATSNKIKQYFLPVSWYDIYDNNGDKSNLPFYVKQVFILLWLISFFVFILSRAKFRI